jgi:hypothetical protein
MTDETSLICFALRFSSLGLYNTVISMCAHMGSSLYIYRDGGKRKKRKKGKE